MLRVPTAAAVVVVGLIVAWLTVTEVYSSASPKGAAAAVINTAVALALIIGLAGAVAVNRAWRVSESNAKLVKKAVAANLAAAVSHSLAEGGLDAQATMTEVAAHLATSLGDACVISVFTEAGVLVPAAVRATEPSVELAVRLGFPVVNVEEGEPYLTAKAVSTSTAQQAYGGSDEVLASSRAALTDLLVATQTQALLIVPMHCFRDTHIPRRGQVVGVIYMMRRCPRGFGPQEVSSLQDVADRAGLALASASLHTAVEAAEQRFRAIFEDAPIGVVLLELANEGRFVDVNDQFCNLTGYSHDELMHIHPGDLVHPDDRESMSAAIASLVWGTASHFEQDARYVRPNGETLWVKTTARVTDQVAGRRDAIAHVEDITDKVRAAEALATSEARFRSAFDHSPAGLAVVSLEEDRQGVVVRANMALSELTGRLPEQIVGTQLADILEVDREGSWAGGTERFVHELLSDHERRLWRWLRPDGLLVWARVSVATLPGEPRQCLVQVDDVTSQKRAEEDLAYRALHDHLTGLANRPLAMDRLSLAIRQLPRTRGVVAALFVDLDVFKQVNDTLGHEGGDEVLRQMGNRLASAVRAPDTAARLGGDEFLVICALGSEDDVHHVVERIQRSVNQPMVVANRSLVLTASIGVALATHASADPDGLVRQADAAMYEVKHHGRKHWQVYNESLHHRVKERQAVELDLRRALRDDLFRLHYQPIFDLAEGRLVGAEALVRMEQPDGRLVFPGSFIEVAEETDLVRPITDWVLQRACAQMAEWSPPPAFHLALNLSGRDLADLAVTGRVLECAQRYGVAPSQLILELTEGVLINGEQAVVKELQRLKEAGARLAIDDFGTGYCSLTYLQRFPVDAVKVDRSFVSGLMANNLHATAIVEAVVALSKTLNLTCIAEGIEEPEQLVTLRSLGCQWGQGFYLGVPLVPDEFTSLFERLEDGEQSERASGL